MESAMIESKNAEVSVNIVTSSNQFIADQLELPDDTFRMSLDNFSTIGENVTIMDRDTSVDSSTLRIAETPELEQPTPISDAQTPPKISPPIIETPKTEAARRPPTLLQLSQARKSENDLFVKPSPIAEVMSPAKMLQFEMEPSSATPTMKRAAIDFDFFIKNKFVGYFDDIKAPATADEELSEPKDGSAYKEIPVIVKADTVRHEIGYDKISRNTISGLDTWKNALIGALGTDKALIDFL